MKPLVNMVGRLTRDVTNTFSNTDGTAQRCLLTVACNSYYNGKDGTKKESVDFIPCVAWGDGRVKTLTTWGKKGRHLHIIGTLEAFTAAPDENGKYPPTKIQVKIEQFEFLDKKPEGIETSAQTPVTGETPQFDMNAMAELVAQKLLGATNTNAGAEQVAETQGSGDLGSVV